MAWPAYELKGGNRPIISARLPAAHAKVLRAHASRTNTPLQAVIRALVADWIKVHVPVHAQPSPSVAVAPAIPQHAPARENTGRNEPIEKLQAIDEARKEPGNPFAD